MQPIHVACVLPESPQREAVAQYIMNGYRRAYGTTPTIPPFVVAAVADRHIVGAFACQLCSEQEEVLWETCFSCGEQTGWLEANRHQLVEFGRWAADSPLASAAVLLAVIREALRLSKRFGLSVAKPKIAEYIQATFGVKMRVMPGAAVRLDGVPDDERTYYMIHQPRLHLVDLAQASDALTTYLAEPFASGHLVME